MTLGLVNRTTPAPAPLVEVTVSTAAFCFDGQNLCLLVRKGGHGRVELPSTAFAPGASVTRCARSILEDIGLCHYVPIHPVGALESAGLGNSEFMGDLSVLTIAVFKPEARREVPEASRDGFEWMPVPQLPSLGLPLRRHAESALQVLRTKARFDCVAFDFLGEEFSLSELQRVFEAILGRTIDVRNFRKKIEALDLLVESPNKPRGMAYRPPRLFRFELAKFEKRLTEDGEIRFF